MESQKLVDNLRGSVLLCVIWRNYVCYMTYIT